MAIESEADYDLGPLSWVQGEIDQALSRGLESLAAFKASPQDTGSLKHARMHVHQAAGAIQMVGLDAVVAFTDEIERQLQRLEEALPGEARAACDAIDRACRKLKIFLDELVNGAPPVPLKLFPEYETMQRQRGVKAASPTDLFYPALSTRAPKLATPQTLAPAKLQSHMVKQRRHYQRGLLAWLRGDEDGAKAMRDAVAGIEAVTAPANLRAFWWTAGALLDALTERGLESSFGVKQLAGRIDLQIRRVVEGSAKVADRLRREVLYYVAISAPVSPSVQAVQRGFKLSGLIPTAEVLNADMVRIQPLLREAREQLGNAKESWLKFTSGRAENLPKLKQTLAGVHKAAAEIGNGALMKLTSSLVERLDKMPGGTIPEPLAMEYATAMLLAESAFENYGALSSDFPKQVESMLARLDAARASRRIPTSGAPALDEMSKRAQERLLLAQVGREIQANLRHMEQVLDAFFRDSAKRADLATLAKDSSQIRGALRILGLDDAEHLLALCQEQIETYAHPDTEVSSDDLELLAESLSGLGFYVEAVEQQRPDRDRLIAPLLAKRLGDAPVKLAERDDSVEAAVAELRSVLPDLVAQVHRAPSDAAARDELHRKLASLRDDAELIGDSELTASAQAALAELEAGGSASLEALTALAESGSAQPAPEISAETQRLLATDATALDAELVDIYLAEAHDVLDTVAEHHAMLVRNPGDREALRTVRRGFHTLKGSGRMVGLTGLGEVAYEVEKIHNRLLDEERPVTAAVVAMIGTAQSSFRGWVRALTESRRVDADPSELHAAIRAVENELPGNRESVLGSAAAAPMVTTLALVEPTPPDEAVPVDDAPEEPEEIEAAPPPLADVLEFPELGSVHASAPRIEPVFVGSTDEDEDEDEDGDVVVELAPPSTASAPLAETLDAQPELDREIESADVPDEIDVGGVRLSSSLYGILVEEADQHVATLAHELNVLQFDPAQSPSDEMVRASHTLCGIHRTGGFPLVAQSAKALEQCLLGLQQHTGPRPGFAPAVLARAVAGLAALVARVKSRTAFTSDDRAESEGIVRELEELRQEIAAEHGAHDAESIAERVAEAEDEGSASQFGDEMAGIRTLPPAAPTILRSADDLRAPHLAPVIPITAAHALSADASALSPDDPSDRHDGVAPAFEVAAAEEEPSLDGVMDEVDADVLPIFLEEAAELFPQAGEELRSWRRSPFDASHAQRLRRTLHTFKGSARMAGAMRLGELTHRMESRLLAGDDVASATPELLDALDNDLDRVAFVLDALREGRFNVALPWMSYASPARETAPPPTAELPAEEPVALSPTVIPIAPYVRVPGGESDAAAASADVQMPFAATTYQAPAPSPDDEESEPATAATSAPAGGMLAEVGAPIEPTSSETPWAADAQASSDAPSPSDEPMAFGEPTASGERTVVDELTSFVEPTAPELLTVVDAPTAFVEPAASDELAVVDAPTAFVETATSDELASHDAPTAFVEPAASDELAVVDAPTAFVETATSDELASHDAPTAFVEPTAPELLTVVDATTAFVEPAASDELAVVDAPAAFVEPAASDELPSPDAPTAFVEPAASDELPSTDTPTAFGGPTVSDELAASGESTGSDATTTSDVPIGPPVAATAPAAPVVAAMPVVPPSAPPLTLAPVTPFVPVAAAAPAATPPIAAPVIAPRVEGVEGESTQRAMLRVRADMIDRLVNEAGEVAIARARVEVELRSLKLNLLELTGSVIRLRTQVREIEIQAESQIQSRMSALQEAHGDFDPLELDRFTRFQELTRSLVEGVNDVSTVQQSLLKNLDDADAALLAQARISREVQQQLFSIRTVPFGSLSDRLFRIMRQTVRELDKRANLEIHGAQTELDRSVLEKLVGPLEHLLRNALDHGIETRDARVAAAKPEAGEIALTVRQVGNEIAIEIADDGRGLDLDDIRAKALAQGKVAPDARPTDAQLIELIFHPGFTTASKVTQISGRGIGMDVVRSEIAALGGRVEVTTQRGRGTRFLLYLPLTLAVAQAVLVRAGGRLWALPSPMVEQVQQVKAEALVNLYLHRSVEWQGRSYPFHYLPRLLGDGTHNPETARYNSVLLLRAGHGLAAIHVDEMIGNQEVVVKNIGPQLARVSGIAGATVLGTGEIVLIINPVQLAQRTDVQVFDPDGEERIAGDHLRPKPIGRPLVLVVDDSLTVRKITSRLLVREGFDVATAKDGLDALQVLGEQTPDVILLDIEMPRMDGFEFTKTIKGDAKFANIPIVMITSRTAEKHRNRAKELGVDLYLGKPFQEEELLRNLREMLEVAAPL